LPLFSVAHAFITVVASFPRLRSTTHPGAAPRRVRPAGRTTAWGSAGRRNGAHPWRPVRSRGGFGWRGETQLEPIGLGIRWIRPCLRRQPKRAAAPWR